jgi:transcriptional regulator of aromatic amino acid metabolism
MEKGTRVGAVLSADEETVLFLGWGTYAGDEVPGPEVAGFMAQLCREMKRPNPKIALDNGKVVFGCECWWGNEEQVKKMIGGRPLKMVDIDALRVEAAQELADEEPEAKA